MLNFPRPANILFAAVGSAGTRSGFSFFLAVILLHGLIGKLVGYFLPIYFNELGFSGIQTGLYFSVTSIAMILLSLPMGISTDRISIAGILMFSFALMSASYIGLIISKSFLVFCFFRPSRKLWRTVFRRRKQFVFFQNDRFGKPA